MFIVVAVLGLVLCNFNLCPDDQVLDKSSDGYRWPGLQHLFLEKEYNEWWFFTLFDEKNDFGLAFGIGVSDPKSELKGNTGGDVMYYPDVISQGTKPLLFGSQYDLSEFKANVDNATLWTPSTTIELLDESGKKYRVKANYLDQGFSLDLTYSQRVYPSTQGIDIHGSDLGVMWESYMPTAHVSGTVKYKEKTYNVENAIGYHDKNWGAWPDSIFNWVWSNYGDPDQGLAIVFGAYKIPLVDDYVGYLFIRIDNENLKLRKELGTLCLNDFTLKVLEKKPGEGGYDYASHLVAEVEEFGGEKWKVRVEIEEVVSYQNPGGKGLGLIVFEMISKYHVDVYKNDQIVLHSEGYGFNEWSDIKKSL